MTYWTCSRCGTVTSRELHWHAGEWCPGPTQPKGPYDVVYAGNVHLSPAPTAPVVAPVLVPDPPKEPTK